MSTDHSPTQNHLLAAMPTAEFERLFPHLELVEMPLGEVLYEPGGRLQHVYFPTTCIVSLLYVLENGASAEIAVVGCEDRDAHHAFAAHHRDLRRGSVPQQVAQRHAARGRDIGAGSHPPRFVAVVFRWHGA